MSSRTQRKHEAREARLAREKEAEARAKRQRRLRLLGAGTLAAVAIVAVLIAVSQGGEDTPGAPSGGEPLVGTAETTRLFEGIPQRGAILGDPAAPLGMIEFVDLQCPFCAQYTRDVLPTLVERYVRPGRLRIELRPLSFIGDDSLEAAASTAAAAGQNRMWQFVDLFFRNQGRENSGYVTADFVGRLARAAGASPAPVVAAAEAGDGGALLARAEREAAQFGVESTPTFLIARGDRPPERLQVGELTPEAFTGPIDRALSGG